ncbi:MAG: signal transduction histidine kinase, LytS [Bacteroidetes bacterium]|nr:signal transduction histidine kinase, LytS [Bacteroidota bacterium]
MGKLLSNGQSRSFYSHSMIGVMTVAAVLYGLALISSFSLHVQKLLVLVAVNVMLLYLSYSFIAKLFIERKNRVKSIVWLAVAVIVTVGLRVAGNQIVMSRFGASPIYLMSEPLRAALMLLGETLLAVFAILLRIGVNSIRNRHRLEELEKLQLTTELQFLKAQMSPHFLFNSINNIYSLVLLKSDNAPEALMKLSDLLRYSLYECHDKVAVSQEIDAIKSYIELFRLKFEEPVPIEMDFEELPVEYKIEPLLFIPLLENALKYSGIGVSFGAFVHLRLVMENDMLVFSVKNSIGERDKNQSASGIGLENIRKRLANIYDRADYEFSTRHEETSFFVILKIRIQ